MKHLWPIADQVDALTQQRAPQTHRLAAQLWAPMPDPAPGVPHPQRLAFESPAAVIGYGGEAGGGKTDLALGLAACKHVRSIIFRRVFPSIRAMIDRSRELFAQQADRARDSFNESLHLWRLADDRQIEFGSLQYEKETTKHRGVPRDLYVFDEATEFTESMVRTVTAWNRTTRTDVRPQVLLTFNPPHDDDGQWIIKFFAPWLDPDYAGCKAESGELRWFVRRDDQDVEVSAETPGARSRTFIAASLKDNAYLLATGYADTIEMLPEPLRSILKGQFGASRRDNPWQLIPRAWVKAAQARWQPEPPSILHCMGVDVARGGADQTTIARRHSTWFAPLIRVAGKLTPTGQSVAALVVQSWADGAGVNIDVIGVGSSPYDHLVDLDVPVHAINSGAGSDATDKSGKLKMGNLRAELWWKFREALDPEQGSQIALPPDAELEQELCMPRFSVRSGRLFVESKDDLRERLKRSTDSADPVIQAWYTAPTVGLRWL
jgi:hypothetical protein